MLLGEGILLILLEESPHEETKCNHHDNFDDEGQRGNDRADDGNNRRYDHDGQNDQQHDA
jgi:hypothetical protein